MQFALSIDVPPYGYETDLGMNPQHLCGCRLVMESGDRYSCIECLKVGYPLADD
jgi:hypothetical protein